MVSVTNVFACSISNEILFAGNGSTEILMVGGVSNKCLLGVSLT